MVGAIVQRNRAWILPKYLEAIHNIDYPKKHIHLAFMINGEQQDNTEGLILDYVDKYKPLYHAADVWFMDDGNIDSRTGKRDYNWFAELRNVFTSMRRRDDTHIFSVDTDIIFPPNTLRRLLLHRKPIVSALVRNQCFKKDLCQYNMMMRPDPKISYYQSVTDPTSGLREVDVTGACYLIDIQVLNNGVCYTGHPQGEDVGFCEIAKEKCYQIYCDQDIHTKHIMENENEG